MRRFSCLVCLSVTLAAGPADAQPASYGADVVYALTGLSGPDAILVGAAPDSLRPFLPADAEVVATTDRPGPFGSRAVTVLARLAQSPDEARAAYVMPEVPGWSLRPVYEGRTDPLSRVGFASDRSSYGPRSILYDPDSGPPATISVRYRPRSEGGAFAEVEYRRLHPMEIGAGTGRQRPSEALEATLPFLTPPEGGRQVRTGGGGGGDNFRSRALLESDLAPAEVAAHYGRLLEAGGWVPGGAVSTDELATSVWTREVHDDAIAATFYAHRAQPGVYSLHVNLIAADR